MPKKILGIVISYALCIITEKHVTGALFTNLPKLNLSEPFLDSKVGQTVYIKCSGDPPLMWEYINPTIPLHDKEILGTRNINHQAQFNLSRNETVLQLHFLSEGETGHYVCRHQEFNASVYIFVDGGKELLLQSPYTLFHQFQHGVSDVIRCLPTMSTANVTLWKIKGSIKEAVALEFNPTLGFLLKNPTDYFQKTFKCIAEYQGRRSSILIDLETFRDTESIPQVYIENNNATYVLVGSTFRLECIVQTELNTMITVNWSYPIKEIADYQDMNRAIERDLPIMKSNAYQNVTKELHIVNATKADDGFYQCNATDHSNKANYAEVYVKVYEVPQEPKVVFASGLEEIIKTRNETVEIVAPYQVFPVSTDIRVVWTKDNESITSDIKKYFTKSTETFFLLEISNLSWKDSGIYTVVVNAAGGVSKKSFYLRVKDTPVVRIQKNATCCYSPRLNYTILCETIGYPTPKIFWNWRPYCLNTSLNCSSSQSNSWLKLGKKHIINNGTIITEIQGDKILSYLSLISGESGFYECQSENQYGVAKEEIEFVVSSVKDGFEIQLENAFPFVNTHVLLTCRASFTIYSNLLWKWMPNFQNETSWIQINSREQLNSSDTISMELEFEEISKNKSGTYICVAFRKDNNDADERKVVIEVLDRAEAIKGQKREFDVLTSVVYPCLGLTFFILILIYIRILFTKKRNSLKLNQQSFRDGRMALFDPNLPLDDQIDLLPYDEKWEFPKEKLKLGRTVGQGAFGRVVKAEAFGITDYETSSTVAVKMLKEQADSNQQKALMDELKILIHLGHHVNIVNLMGAVTKYIQKGELMVIVEYCRYGNIRHYFHRHRESFVNEIDPVTKKIVPFSHFFDEKNVGFRIEPFRSSTSSSSSTFAIDNPNYRQSGRKISSNPRGSTSSHTILYSSTSSSGCSSVFPNYSRTDSQEHIITTSDLLCYAFQCACGMEYLSSKKLIHRDLAARNVLLAEDKVVKICDFGLAKDCYKYSNYIKKGDGPLPIKWMSIESIWDHIFTTKSDVWSFGILMWEFFTLGGNPYPGIDIDEEFYKKLKSGYRMEKPEMCPDFVYQIMKDCWNADPDERPSFSRLSEMFGNSLEEGIKQHYIDLNESYMEMNRKMQVPDYSNIEKPQNPEAEKYYANSEIIPEMTIYDVPLNNQLLLNALEPKTPMNIVPMVQLETISESNKTNNILGQLKAPELYRPDYLQMQKVEVP